MTYRNLKDATEATGWLVDLTEALLADGLEAAGPLISSLPPDRFHLQFLLRVLPLSAAQIMPTPTDPNNPNAVYLAVPRFSENATPAVKQSGRIAAAAFNNDQPALDALVDASLNLTDTMTATQASQYLAAIVGNLTKLYHTALIEKHRK